MSDAATHPIACPGCQKRYRWKAQLAGRKVRCGCGQVMHMPDTDPAAEQSTDEGGYELNLTPEAMPQPQATAPKHEGKCPNCNMAMSESAVLCLNCGFNVAQGQVIQPKIDLGGAPDKKKLSREERRVQRDQEMEEQVVQAAHWVDVKLPILLLVIGMLTTIVYGWLASEGHIGNTAIFVLHSLGLHVFVYTPMSLVCVLILVRLLDLGLGTVQSVLFKLIAIVIGPMAIADLVAYFVLPYFAGWGVIVVYGAIQLIFTGSAFAKLFDLDFFETTIATVILTVSRIATDLVVELIDL